MTACNTNVSILFITVRADWGGGPEHLWGLLQNTPEDFTPVVACPNEEPYYRRYTEIVDEENIFPIPHRQFKLSKFFRLRSFCKKRKVQLIHSHGKGAGLYGRLLSFFSGIPCVHTPHGVHADSLAPIQRKIYLLYEYVASLLSKRIISVSASESEQIENLNFSPKSKVAVIANGVHVPGESITLPSEPPYRIIHVSRFDVAKNSELLIDILKEFESRNLLGSFQFIIIGDGERRAFFEDGINRLGFSGAVVFAGFIENPNTYFNNALCLLSTSRWEGMPLAVLEAMAHGLVPVVSDVVGNRDAVGHMLTGMLYPLEKTELAVDAITKLADSPDLLARLSLNARSNVLANYSIKDCAQKTFELYREVLVQ